MSTVHLLNFNGAMLCDVTDPNRFSNFLTNVLNYAPAAVTLVETDALRLLVTLAIARKPEDEKLLSIVVGTGNLPDPAYDYPSHISGEAQRNEFSANHIWKAWVKMSGKAVPLESRMRPAHITDRRKAYRTGGAVKSFVEFGKDLNDAQREDDDINLATGSGKSLTFTSPSKGDDVKRFGKLNTVVGRYCFNESVAGNFTNSELASFTGSRGLRHGVRYYLTESTTDELQRKYNRFIARAGVSLQITVACLNRFDRAFQDARAMQPDDNPNDLWIECVNSADVWKLQSEESEAPEDSNVQPCFDHFLGRGCTRKDCKFRHNGAAPRPRNNGGRWGGGGWGQGGWAQSGSYVPLDADG